ncbi:MAG TPA: M6 family metalloprotease domain-containing protein, partial [Anaerolineae bacterium]|nr:M6 family metalloprotease domain-containing protein [Anaerolineae bacterium]
MEHRDVSKRRILAVGVAIFLLLALTGTVMASPPYPEGPERSVTIEPADQLLPSRAPGAKAIDQPNIKDYLRNEERQRLLEAGDTAGAEALSLVAHDRALVILVEFSGTDVFTWEEGVSTWDPYGRADPNEYTGTVGDCSLIITETKTFTYTGPLHNEIPRPLSEEDRSGDSIWTEDFSLEWFDGFLFGEGVVFDYTRVDGSEVYEDFTGKSVQDYSEDMSAGDYHVTGDVIGWVQVPHSTWYYDADECPGARSGASTRRGGLIPGAGNARTLVRDALDAVNAISDTIPGFDWANYDLDGNGIIDRLWIVHAGYGEEDAPVLLNRTDYAESAVWSHSSSVSPPYEVAPGIAAGPYIMMPENGGLGVFAHEAGHNLGADDLYAYGEGDTSAGFWTLMADDWTGYPIGFEPPAVDPWHLDRWGWLDPFVVTDTSQVYEVTLGQASRFPDEEGMYRGAKIELADGEIPLAVPVWQGAYYWFGGKKDLANARMTTANPIDLTGATNASLAFDLVYDIEDEWDFLWVQVSTDGVNWPVEDTLTNANTQCLHDSGWIGGLYGFPEDLCGAGLGGFYGYNANWPDPELQEFDLTPYVGQNIWLRFWFMTDWATTYSGAFVDNVEVAADAVTIFSDDAEGGDANWVYEDPWIRTDGVMPYTHNFYLQWRNLNDESGYDSALGDPRWRFGPANTGLLVWYNNNFYTDNEVWSYLFDEPSVGPKGRMLVVDAHPEPYRDPDMVALGFDNEGGNLTTRGQMRDAPFTLADTV